MLKAIKKCLSVRVVVKKVQSFVNFADMDLLRKKCIITIPHIVSVMILVIFVRYADLPRLK